MTVDSPVSLAGTAETPRLVLAGVVGIASASRLREIAVGIAEAGRTTTLDACGLRHLHAAAAQILIALRTALRSRGAELAVETGPSAAGALRYAGLLPATPAGRGPGNGAGK